MKNFLEIKSLLSDKQIEELLYYYNQGVYIGKEETLTKIINNLFNLSYDKNEIAKIVEVKVEKLKNYIN